MRWLLAVLFLVGCSGRHVVGTVVLPPELPVHAFAPVVVLHATDEPSTDAATLLASALRRRDVAVVLGTTLTDADRRAAGIVLRVAVRFTVRRETRWGSRPETTCSAYGCYTRQASYPYEYRAMLAELELEVVDIQTNEVIAQRAVRNYDAGADNPARRLVTARDLAVVAAELFRDRRSEVSVRLARRPSPGVERAYAFARVGRYADAAAELGTELDRTAREGADDDAAWRAARLAERASFLRLASSTSEDPVAQLDAAIEALARSLELDADEAVAAELVRTRQERAAHAALRPARSAAETIEVPPSYR